MIAQDLFKLMVIFNSEISSVHIAQADLELTTLLNQLAQGLGIQVCATRLD